MEYNGWANKATWLVNVWLTNDEGTYNEVRELLADKEGIEADEALEKFTEDLVTAQIENAHGSLAYDLAISACGSADWISLTNSFKE